MTHRTLISLLLLTPSISHGSLIAHWKLDSSPADEVASFPGTWSGTPAYSTPVEAPESSAAASLAGTWLDAGTGINFERNQAFSATAWIKGGAQDSTVVGDMLHLEGHQGWELHVGTGENGASPQGVTIWLIHDYPADAIQVNAAVPVLDNQWHHVAFTYDGSSTADGVKIYVDGSPVATEAGLDTLGGNIANGAGAPLNIGSRMNGAAHQFTGAIDEVAIFDQELTAAEMLVVHSSGIEAVAPPVVSSTVPLPGQVVATLVSADVTFSVPVDGVDASDLLVNGVSATGVSSADGKHYQFSFPAPAQGEIQFTWAAGHGITGHHGSAALPAPWTATFTPVLPVPQVAISEFLTQNAGGLADEDYDTPDWIELWNPGTIDVNLAGWALSDDPARPRLWVLPSLILHPGDRRIVFASGKNRTVPTGVLHTNFKLSSTTGYLGLTDPSGNVAHAYDQYPRQEANVSFGLLTTGRPADGRSAWRYLTPTPGAVPSGVTYSGAAIMSLEATPAVPQPGEPITITMRLAPGSVPTSTPTLRYKLMQGAELQLLFADDGLHGDGAAGDGVWGATITTNTSAGQMIRWKAALSDNGITCRWPINTNATLSLPLYEGTVIGGSPGDQALPVYQFFVPSYVIPTTTSQTGIDSDTGARGAFFGNGKLYDNVLIRIKGTTSRYLLKRSHRVDFNPGRDFEWSPDFPAQRELNLNSEYNDPSYLRQNLQHWMHHDSGNAGAPHFPVRMLMNGLSWQLGFHTYSADSELTEVLGLNPRGALYKQVGTLANGSGGEKKSRKWEGSSDLSALTSGLSTSNATNRTRYVYDNLNLPAVINYLAVTRIAQEGDDVWANMVVYRDSDDSGEWRPIPFDLNLSFGQLFYGFSGDPIKNTIVQATNDANKSHPLYGSSACLPNTGSTTQYNRLYNAIIQDPVTRSMLLRRMRTLMDRYLKPPGTMAGDSPLESRFDAMGALILEDANSDRTRWGLPPNANAYGLGPGITPSQGLATLKSDYLVPRRGHLYQTHSVNNTAKSTGISNNSNAAIPNTQATLPVINFGNVEANPVSGNQDQEYIELSNPGGNAVDISDWVLRGASGSFKMKGGTVIAAGGTLHVSPKVAAFRARTASPKGGQSLYVVGPYSGHLSAYGETLYLENPDGVTIAQKSVAADPNAPQVHLAVTEILSNSAHASSAINGDWWELTNTGTQPLDLTGFSWDDSRDLPGQAAFGAVTLAAGESLIVLDEDDSDKAALFRDAWALAASVKILTREDFGLESLRGLGNGDAVVVYLPNGTEVTRASYPAHATGRSRIWFRNGNPVPGGYSELGKYGSVASADTPGDIASPGLTTPDPATLTAPYDIWAAANDLWTAAAIAPDADPDGDGRSTRAEYAFGGLPGVFDAAPPGAMQRVGGEVEWTFLRRGNDPSLVFSIESSVDLSTWTAATLALVGEVPDPELEGYVRATYKITPGGDAKFFRARSN